MTYKQKNIALVIGFLLLLWLSYQFSIPKTLNLKKQYNNLLEDTAILENGLDKIRQLKAENSYYDSIFESKKIAASSSFQNNLLTKVTAFGAENNLKVVSFNAPHVFDNNGTYINSYGLTVRADFNTITTLIYELEHNFKLGKIISVHFKKKRDYRRRRNYLDCELLLQRIEK